MTHYKGTNGTHFHHNTDFSGNILIIDKNGKEFEIPGHDILELIAYNYIMNNRISNIEDMDYLELLSKKGK